MFYLYFNKKSKDKFFKINSRDFQIFIEILSGIIYALIIFISLFLKTTSLSFLGITGMIIYVIGICLTYMGYFKFLNKEKLITKFPFNISRNPTYFFAFVAILGLVLITNSWYLFVLLILQVILTHLIILNEEAFLEKEYGKEYLIYKKKVRRYI